MSSEQANHRIRFGDKEIPTCDAWAKLEIATQALEVLSRYNTELPNLASDLTRTTEEEVRKRLGGIEILIPPPPKRSEDLVDTVRALLLNHTPEDALDILARDHNADLDLNALVHLAGSEAYLQCLSNEVTTFRQNAISFEQIAELWNDAKRPAPGKPFWDKFSVEQLFDEAT